MGDDLKHMDIAEFRKEGYLQEVNRRFLHPLGLALEVVAGADGTEKLGGVWDSRDDPEGIVFVPGDDLGVHADHVDALLRSRSAARMMALGFVTQPANGSA